MTHADSRTNPQNSTDLSSAAAINRTLKAQDIIFSNDSLVPTGKSALNVSRKSAKSVVRVKRQFNKSGNLAANRYSMSSLNHMPKMQESMKGSRQGRAKSISS